MKKTSRNHPLTWLMPLGTLIQFLLPRWLVSRIATVIGYLAFKLSHRQREKLIENYRHIFGASAPRQLLQTTAQHAFKNLALFYADLLRIPVMKKRILSLAEMAPGSINLLLQRKTSVILVTAHIGNWDLAGAFLSALGYPISAVVEPIPRGWTKTFNRYRATFAMETIPIPEHDRIRLAIERGRILALVADRDLTGRGILCPAFDAHRSYPKGPAVYSLRYNLPVVIGYFIYQRKTNRPPYLAVVEPPIEFQPSGNLGDDIVTLTRIIAQRLNQLISRYPDQWLVFNAGWQ